MSLEDWKKRIIHDRKTFGLEVECFWHGPEDQVNVWWICFECDHAFRTEKDLLREHRRLAWTIGWRYWLKSLNMKSDDIESCPLCNHDW